MKESSACAITPVLTCKKYFKSSPLEVKLNENYCLKKLIVNLKDLYIHKNVFSHKFSLSK